MKKLLLVLLALSLSHICSAVELIELKSTDGRAINVLIDNYVPRKKEVSIRLNGTGKLMRFSMDRLDEASQGKVEDWYELNSVVMSLTIRTERLPARVRSERLFSIELTSSAEVDIEDVRVDYLIPVKGSRMVKEGDSDKYVKKELKRVVEGSIDVGTIVARSERKVNTESVETSETQVLKLAKGKTKEVNNSHSIKGLLLKIYVGDTMVREYQSQNGVSELIAKYSGSSGE